jgi:integrase
MREVQGGVDEHTVIECACCIVPTRQPVFRGLARSLHVEDVVGCGRDRVVYDLRVIDRRERVLRHVRVCEQVDERMVQQAGLRLEHRSALDNVLLPRFGKWRVSAIDATAIAELIRDLETKGLHAIDPKRRKRPLSASTIANYILPLQGVLTLAVRRGLIGTNPCSILTPDERPARKPKRAMVEWSDDQIAALVAAAEELARKPGSGFNYAPIIAIAAKTGLRLGELLGLQWRDVDLEEGVIRVERQLARNGELAEPKTQQAIRRVPISQDVSARLRKLKLASRHSRDDHPVFASRNGTPLSHRNVQRRGFDPAAAAAGLTGATFHQLRHAAASKLIDAGLSPVAVAAVLGHRDARITLSTYAHRFNKQSSDDAVRRAMGGNA